MANPHHLGITIGIDNSQATKALLSMQGTLDDMNKKQQRNNDNQQQAIANLVDGLSFVKSSMDGLITIVDRFGEATRLAFVEAESALTNINITIGRTGDMMNKMNFDKSDSRFGLAEGLDGEFSAIKDKVAELARNTEFSYTEIANLFRTLKQSGLNTATVMNRMKDASGNFNDKSILEATLAFTSASRGALTLDEAAKTLILSSNSLNTGLNGVEKNADRLVRMVNNADVSFGDLSIMMESLSGAGKALFSGSGPEQIITLLAALKTAGKSPAQAGQYLVGFGRSLNNLMADFLKQEEYLEGKQSYFARRKKGKGFGAPKQRRAVKMFALARLGLTQDTFLDKATGQLRPLLGIMQSLRRAAKAVVTDKKAFKDLTGRSIDPKRTLGQAEALALIYKSLGTQEATQLVQATEMLEGRLAQSGKSKAESTMFAFAKNIDKTYNDSLRAQQTALEDNVGVTKLLESAMFSLNMQVGGVTGEYDKFTKIVAKNVISAFDSMLRGSKGLTGMIGTMIIGLKILATVLGIAAGGILALGMLGQVQAGVAIAVASATKTLGLAVGTTATMSQTIGVYLSSVMPFIGPLILAVGLVATLSGVFFELSTNSENYFGWLSGSLKTVGDAFKNFATFYIPTLMGKTIFNDEKFADASALTSKSVQDLTLSLSVVAKHIKDLFGSGFTAMAMTFDILMSGILWPFKALMDAITWSFMQGIKTIDLLIDFFGSGGKAVAESATELEYYEARLKEVNVLTEYAGYILGGLAGFYLTYATVLGIVKAATVSYAVVTRTLTIATNLLTGALNLNTKWSMISVGLMKIKTATMGALAFAVKAGTWATLGFVFAWMAGLVVLAVLVGYLMTADRSTLGFKIALTVATAMSVVMIAMLAKMAVGFFAAAFGAGALSAGLFPIIATVIAVVAVIGLLAYGVYKLLQLFGMVGKSSKGMGSSLKNLGNDAKKMVAGAEIKGAKGQKAKVDVEQLMKEQTPRALIGGNGPIKALEDTSLSGVKVPKVSIPGLGKVEGKMPKIEDLSSLNQHVPGSGGNTINQTFQLSTNVQQLDPITLKRVAKQFAPLVAKEVQKATV